MVTTTVKRKAEIYADGGSRGNPGPSGAGAIITIDGKTQATISSFVGHTTNNVAEYTGLVLALEKAVELGIDDVHVFMDSELVVKQMLGIYRVKNEKLLPLFVKARGLVSKLSSFSISHVRRENNKIADQLANQAMDEARESFK